MQLRTITPLIKPMMFTAARASPVLVQRRNFITTKFIGLCFDLFSISVLLSVFRRTKLFNSANVVANIKDPRWREVGFKYLDVGERCTQYCIDTVQDFNQKYMFGRGLPHQNKGSSSNDSYNYRNQSNHHNNRY